MCSVPPPQGSGKYDEAKPAMSDMTIKTDNAAGRLHGILTRAKDHPNNCGYQLWANVFEIATTQGGELSEEDTIIAALKAVRTQACI